MLGKLASNNKHLANWVVARLVLYFYNGIVSPWHMFRNQKCLSLLFSYHEQHFQFSEYLLHYNNPESYAIFCCVVPSYSRNIIFHIVQSNLFFNVKLSSIWSTHFCIMLWHSLVLCVCDRHHFVLPFEDLYLCIRRICVLVFWKNNTSLYGSSVSPSVTQLLRIICSQKVLIYFHN